MEFALLMHLLSKQSDSKNCLQDFMISVLYTN
jgi:hypothetical protein